MAPKTLAVVTGTRAEYGLLRPVIYKLLKSDKIIPKVIATGAHLALEYGNTIQEIQKDGVPVEAEIPILEFGSGPLATARTIALTIDRFSHWFEENHPDGVLVLGDRYEIFGVVTAAAALGIPVFHISGGDVTLGAADDYYRHCITKMAAVHFPSCPDSARRLLHLGEQPDSIYMVGGLGDENIRSVPRMSARELSDSLGVDLTRPFGLVTFHPETAGMVSPLDQMDALLEAMEETPDLFWVITKSNADAGGQAINEKIDCWAAAHQDRAAAFTSLGLVRYLSAMALARVVAGNSSSGVVETPTFGVPTVNIGNRQAGRIICDNVLCCPAEKTAIRAALDKALTPAFRQKARQTVSPYNGGDTSGKIVALLEEKLYDPSLGAPKVFYDGPVEDVL